MNKYHFTIHGNEHEGWSLNVYKIIPDPFNKKYETITTHWLTPKLFDRFSELQIELNKMFNEEVSWN